jgi:hypothetical protein
MSLQLITETKYWAKKNEEAIDLSTRINMAVATNEAIKLFQNLGCSIDYYWDTQHDTVVYQPYMKRDKR